MDDNQKGIPTISPVDNSTAAVSRFSALNDNDKVTKDNPDKQEKDKIKSKTPRQKRLDALKEFMVFRK